MREPKRFAGPWNARLQTHRDGGSRPGLRRSLRVSRVGMVVAAGLLLGGCVFQSTYNNMVQQQQAIESALRSEISADQWPATPTTCPSAPKLADRYPTNWELAAARAALVVRHLQAGGVDPTAMQAVSAGQYHPVACNDTAESRARNRNLALLLRPR